MSYATKEQLAELAAYMASQINVPTIGIGGGYAPIGTIISYMGTTAPQDYLACDGSTKNIADYPQLADFFEAQFGSKNYFGGDGVTTFAVPDLQGEFLRGTGTNSHTGQGSGANVGVHQDGTLHTYSYNDGTSLLNSGNLLANTDVTNENISRKFLNAGSNIDDGGKTYTSRPTNTSILWCIKAVNAGEVYSTEERVVGTWIDGKKIYQKVFNLGNQQYSINTDTDILVNNELFNIVDLCISCDIVYIFDNGSNREIGKFSKTNNSGVFFSKTNKKVHIYNGNYGTNNFEQSWLIYQYTKTTD